VNNLESIDLLLSNLMLLVSLIGFAVAKVYD